MLMIRKKAHATLPHPARCIGPIAQSRRWFPGSQISMGFDSPNSHYAQISVSQRVNFGIKIVRTPVGTPVLRGMIERLFRTAAMKLFACLSGRTFSNVLERGDHPAEDRACLTTEDLCFALVRWIADIYHNTTHEGLGSRMPQQQGKQDLKDGNYPLHVLPTRQQRRLGLGRSLARTLQKDGITVLG